MPGSQTKCECVARRRRRRREAGRSDSPSILKLPRGCVHVDGRVPRRRRSSLTCSRTIAVAGADPARVDVEHDGGVDRRPRGECDVAVCRRPSPKSSAACGLSARAAGRGTSRPHSIVGTSGSRHQRYVRPNRTRSDACNDSRRRHTAWASPSIARYAVAQAATSGTRRARRAPARGRRPCTRAPRGRARRSVGQVGGAPRLAPVAGERAVDRVRACCSTGARRACARDASIVVAERAVVDRCRSRVSPLDEVVETDRVDRRAAGDDVPGEHRAHVDDRRPQRQGPRPVLLEQERHRRPVRLAERRRDDSPARRRTSAPADPRPCPAAHRRRLSSTPARLSAIDASTSAVLLSGTTRWTGLGCSGFALRASAIAAEISLPRSHRTTAGASRATAGCRRRTYAQSRRPPSVTRWTPSPCTPSAAASDFATTTFTVPG